MQKGNVSMIKIIGPNLNIKYECLIKSVLIADQIIAIGNEMCV